MIKYRPHRGSLADAMAEMKTFETLDEMKQHIISSWSYLDLIDRNVNCFGPDDIVLHETNMDDDRIGWKNVCYVCIKRLLSDHFEYPQCIGQCTFDD